MAARFKDKVIITTGAGKGIFELNKETRLPELLATPPSVTVEATMQELSTL